MPRGRGKAIDRQCERDRGSGMFVLGLDVAEKRSGGPTKRGRSEEASEEGRRTRPSAMPPPVCPVCSRAGSGRCASPSFFPSSASLLSFSFSLFFLPSFLSLSLSSSSSSSRVSPDSLVNGPAVDTMNSLKPDSGLARAARYAVPFVLLLVPIWMTKVNTVVPEPYLDEVFHVPQAQAYWHHKWTHWDPKITTPPGLYLWSYVICSGILALRGTPTELNPEALRATNVAAGAVFLPWRLQTLLDTLRKQRNTRPAGAWLSHTVLNICLFPPIFFFSGLYYTDILSLLVVIEAYNWDLKRTSTITTVYHRHLVFIVFALLSLVFRQTNIFWVSVFLGGLQAVRTLKKLSNNTAPGSKDSLHDPLVSEAAIGGECASASRNKSASLIGSRLLPDSFFPRPRHSTQSGSHHNRCYSLFHSSCCLRWFRDVE